MANKTLNASVKLDTKSAVSSLTRLEKKIIAVNKAINKTSTGNNKLNAAINKAVASTNKLERTTSKLKNTTDKVANSAKKVNSANEKAANSAYKMRNGYTASNTAANRLLHTVRSLAATYLGVMGMKAVIGSADTISSAENRLNNLSGGNPQLTQETLDKIYASSQRSRSGYGDTLANVSKLMTLAGGAFDNNIDNAIKFQEIMSKSYTVGGASAAEQASSMYQLVQALGSGVLQGDELRSVREGAPLAYQAIEKFAQGVYNTDESLKELASQGKITSALVVAAIMDMENGTDNINKKFENTKMTFAQAWTSIKNIALKAFEPVLQMLNDVLNSDAGQAIIIGLGNALVWLANIVLKVGELIGNFFDWCAEHTEQVKRVIVTSLIVIAGYLTYTAIVAIVNFLATYGVILVVIGAVVLLIYAMYKLGMTTEQIVGGICGAVVFLAYLIWDIIVWVITIIYYAVAIIWDACVVLGSAILKLVIGIGTGLLLAIQMILQLIMWLVITIWGVLVTIYDAIYSIVKGIWGIFKGLIVGIYQMFVWLGEGVLYILLSIAKAIDAIFGSELSKTVSKWIDSLDGSVDKLNDKLDPKGEFEDIGDQWKKSYDQLGAMYAGSGEYDDFNITDNMTNVINGAGNLMDNIEDGKIDLILDPTALDNWALDSTINPLDGWDKGYDFGSNLGKDLESMVDFFKNPTLTVNGLIDPTDPSYALNSNYNPEDLLASLEGIDSNVGDIKDSMDLSNDDLEYLRKIADMEWRNEFTTAEIRVDMTNNNTVSGERDLDGIVEYLSDVLREEMTNVAYGVHY